MSFGELIYPVRPIYYILATLFNLIRLHPISQNFSIRYYQAVSRYPNEKVKKLAILLSKIDQKENGNTKGLGIYNIQTIFNSEIPKENSNDVGKRYKEYAHLVKECPMD